MSRAVSKGIRGARLSRNLSQAELAKHLGVTAQAVSWWENGGEPTLGNLRKIARITKTSLADLLAEPSR